MTEFEGIAIAPKTKFASVRFMMTLHNYSDTELMLIWNSFKDLSKYFVIGFEVAPAMKVKHLQIYVEYKKAYSFDTLRKLYGIKGLHLEAAKKCREACSYYCMKEKHYIYFDSAKPTER